MPRLDRREEARLLTAEELRQIELRASGTANYSDVELRAAGKAADADRLLLLAHLRAQSVHAAGA